MKLLKTVAIAACVCVVPTGASALCTPVGEAPALILNSAKTIPVNVGGIPFFGANAPFEIERIDGETATVVETATEDSLNPDIRVVTPTGWAVGNTYHIVLADGDTSVIDETVTVVDGFSLTGDAELRVSYTEDTVLGESVADAEITMNGIAELNDPSLSPYLIFETKIDGERASSCTTGPHPGATSFGPGVDHLRAVCGGGNLEDFMASGTYSVEMHVSIIGEAATQNTEAILVNLCDSAGGRTNGDTPETLDDGCSSTSGNAGLIALLGLVGLLRRR
ncbi:MAG: MYXO-CTERM sorting domain-containing protein [bacterium]